MKRRENRFPAYGRPTLQYRIRLVLAGFAMVLAIVGGCSEDDDPPPPPPPGQWPYTSNPSARTDEAIAVVLDATAVYVVGYDETQGADDFQWRIEKINQSDGSLVTSFGTGGVATSNPSIDYDEPTAAAVDGSALYVVGFDESQGLGQRQWRIEKRSLADGSLVSAFGTGGVVVSDPGGWGGQANAIVLDATAMYVVGVDGSLGFDWQWRIEKRSLTDGSLISGFGTGGALVTNPDTARDEPLAVVRDTTHLFVAGQQEIAGPDTQWRLEKRLLTDGSLDGSFGAGGVITSNPSSRFGERATGIAIGATDMIVCGNDESISSSDR
jgi:hypothetical protein